MEEFKVNQSLPVVEQIQKLEDNDIKLWAAVIGTQNDVKSLTVQIDESNKYLREQNGQILKEVLTGNKESQAREDERRLLQEQNKSKFWIAAVGSGGVVALFLQLIFQLLSS